MSKMFSCNIGIGKDLGRILPAVCLCGMLLCGCSARGGKSADSSEIISETEDAEQVLCAFSADSAYAYVKRQVDFGPRVPNTDAHRKAGDWLASELRRHGAEVTEQRTTLSAFDGTALQARNIFARYNPESADRLLLLAHWDCRPWADEDADESLRSRPVDGANDGASGVGVLLEIARRLKEEAPRKGVDILFVDAEDWGNDGDEDSWALGAQYFVDNPPVAAYSPREAILLDMVGGKDALFCREYFSEKAAQSLNSAIWNIASGAGYGDTFINRVGGAINDDHLRFINAGIPAIDIIEFNPDTKGFNPRWHTTSDNMDGIDAATLGKVGSVVMTYIRKNY